MSNSTFLKSVLLGVSSLLWVTSTAHGIPTTSQTLNLCVGEAHVIEASANEVFTYTNLPKAGLSHQALAVEARTADMKGWRMSDAEGSAVWTELRPNAAYLASENKGAKSPVTGYLKAVHKTGLSRVVIQARSEGLHTVEYYAFHSLKKKVTKHLAKVRVSQCGASTAVVNDDAQVWCQGQVAYAQTGTEVLAGTQSMYEFEGANTARRYFASQRPGRVMFSHQKQGAQTYRELNVVLPNGEGVCGFADEARLEALEGKNNYLLQVCSGDIWVAPSGQRIDTVKTLKAKTNKDNVNILVESASNRDGLSVRVLGQGNAKVTMTFENPDATPATIYVESVQCD